MMGEVVGIVDEKGLFDLLFCGEVNLMDVVGVYVGEWFLFVGIYVFVVDVCVVFVDVDVLLVMEDGKLYMVLMC